MQISHIALWVKDLEKMRNFYELFFHVTVSEKYKNPAKEFSSYFISFESGSRLELMHSPHVLSSDEPTERIGYAHMAISLGSPQEVDRLTETLRQSGYSVIGEPRVTGDGFYESVVLDAEGNTLELVE